MKLIIEYFRRNIKFYKFVIRKDWEEEQNHKKMPRAGTLGEGTVIHR
jgi:hypothetical protein